MSLKSCCLLIGITDFANILKDVDNKSWIVVTEERISQSLIALFALLQMVRSVVI